ncbi:MULTISPECIES: hypothetical protein, partial [unclassified Colwellia]|uniref:hypothetical protein n=2 Tax=unclassified Colwellia TaxID=196834 RepID=UPI001C711FD1
VRYTIMLDEFRYILTEIKVVADPKWGASIELIDYEHRDYIEDVLTEHFDLESAFQSNEDVTNDYVLYFCDNASFDQVAEVVKKINEYHRVNDKEYAIVGYT